MILLGFGVSAHPSLCSGWTLMELMWEYAALRGAVAVVVFVVLFRIARYRWRDRESHLGPPDIGLD